MPFNVNVGPYQGGNFLASGLSNLGQGIAEGMQKMQEAQQNEAADNLIIQHAKQTGMITPEQYTEFLNGSRTQKNGIVAGLARNFATDLQRQKQAQDEKELALRYRVLNQNIAEANWTPDEAAKQAARWAGGELVPTGRGKYTFAPYGDNAGTPTGKPEMTRLKDPNTGKDLPFFSVTYPGTKQMQVLVDPNAGLVTDPTTGAMGYPGKTGTRPLSAQDQMYIDMLQRRKQAEASGNTQQPGKLDQIWNAIKSWNNVATRASGGGAAAPAIATSASPVAAGVSPANGMPPSPDAAVAPKKLDQATALEFLRQAGGDKDKARQLAAAAGYAF